MSNYFIFIAFTFMVIFILLDLVFYVYRKKNYSDDPENSLLNHGVAWISRMTGKIPKFDFSNQIRRVQISKDQVSSLDSSRIENENETASKSGSTINEPIQHKTTYTETIVTHNISEQSASDKPVHIQISADIPVGTVIQLTIKVETNQGVDVVENVLQQPAEKESLHALRKKRSFQQKKAINRIRQWVSELGISRFLSTQSPDRLFLIAAILMYALIVGIGIDRYPIYFFTDEAIHMNLASNFIRDGFENYFGEFLPTFFTTEGWVNGTSVYVQVIPMLLFGKSVIVTRAVSAFISLLGSLAASLLLRDVLKLKYYWAGIFMVLITPAWFLHARTAFEYVEVGSFYSIFLYFYSRYRAGYLRSFYWAIIAGALAFYTHGLGQILMGGTGAILFLVDFRYHTHPDQRKTVTRGIILGLILLMPFARYYFAHPDEAAGQVKRRGSYWVNENLSLFQKFGEFLNQYLYGLSPNYWYFKNPVDLSRHTMNGYGNGLAITLPFLLIGLGRAIKNIKLPSYRIIIIALLVCPIPASVVAIGMPRMLWMTIPVALLTTIGISTAIQWVASRWSFHPGWITSFLFLVLAGASIFMLNDALVNGPIWFQDYSLYGMQYGAKQVFQDVVLDGLEKDPLRRYIVSPSWANGTEQFIEFFIPDKLRSRVGLGQPENFVPEIKQNSSNIFFVATANEYEKLITDPLYKDVSVKQILPYPNKSPGFYVLTLSAADNIDEIITQKQEKNRTPVENSLLLNGHTLRIVHSPLGSGRLEDIFDDDPDTLARVLEANPFTFDIYPSKPINTNSIAIQTGSLDKFTVTVSLYGPGMNEPMEYKQTFTDLPPDPLVAMTFDKGPATSTRIYIQIHDDSSGITSQIHVRGIEFK